MEFVAKDSEALLPSFAHSNMKRSPRGDRKSTRLNSSHGYISYAVFCLKKKKFCKNARHGESGEQPGDERDRAFRYPADGFWRHASAGYFPVSRPVCVS